MFGEKTFPHDGKERNLLPPGLRGGVRSYYHRKGITEGKLILGLQKGWGGTLPCSGKGEGEHS